MIKINYLENLRMRSPEVQAKIANGIESDRKGFATIFTERNETIFLKLKRHEFCFGCKLDFTQLENPAYTEVFLRLFNTAELSLPRNSSGRIDSDSMERQLEFCRANHLHVRMSPLFSPSENLFKGGRDPFFLFGEMEDLLSDAADKYGVRIPDWNIMANDIGKEQNPFPRKTVERVFEMAKKYLPSRCRLHYVEEYVSVWNRRCYSHIGILAEQLKFRGVPLDGIGIRYQPFDTDPVCDHEVDENSRFYYTKTDSLNPLSPFSIFDSLETLGIRAFPTDIRIPSRSSECTEIDEAFQAEVASRMLEVWFSHKNCEGVFFHGLYDDGADQSGFLDAKGNPRPIVNALESSMKNWNSSFSLSLTPGAGTVFHGFYGDYEAVSGKDVKKIGFYRDGFNHILL